jgi:hypothetical protein
MQVRFFNELDPADPQGQKQRLLIGLSPEDPDLGERREAVRVATEEDMATYGAAYAAYEEAQKAALEAQKKAEAESHAAETHMPAPPAGRSVPRGTSGSER